MRASLAGLGTPCALGCALGASGTKTTRAPVEVSQPTTSSMRWIRSWLPSIVPKWDKRPATIRADVSQLLTQTTTSGRKRATAAR